MCKETLDFCIIGTGISGSTIANKLNKNFNLEVFEKAKGIGGRSSFKRLKKKIGFDHGLQYLSPKSKVFKKYTRELIRKKILKKWSGNHVFLNEKKVNNKKHLKLIGRHGNNEISKYLLKNIKCNFQHHLLKIKLNKKIWELNFKGNKIVKTKNLIITAPFEQSKTLTKKFVKTKIFKKNIKMNSGITVMFESNKTKSSPNSFFFDDDILGWASFENSKKRFNYRRDLWVLQSNFKYGGKHIKKYRNKKKYYTNLFVRRFKKISKIKIKKTYYTHIHGWLYSSNSRPLNLSSYWDKKIGLGICADWFGGPRLENGWLSARDLYQKIMYN